MIYIAVIFVAVLFICTVFTHFLSVKQRSAHILSQVLIVSVSFGAFLCFASLIIYYVTVSGIDSEELAAAAGDAFYVFSAPALIFTAVAVAMTVGLHFLSGKAKAARIAVSHLSALLILLYALICASWSHYDEIDIAFYITLLGTGLALLCLVSPALQMRLLDRQLGDPEYVRAKLRAFKEKREPYLERKRIRETKKRIKSRRKK